MTATALSKTTAALPTVFEPGRRSPLSNNVQIAPAAAIMPLMPLQSAIKLAAQIEDKSSALWRCVSIVPLSEGGNLTRFIFRMSFFPGNEQIYNQFVQDSQKRIYPAVDPQPGEHIFNTSDSNLLGWLVNVVQSSDAEFYKILQELGYSCFVKTKYTEKLLYITAPDREALQIRWEEYRKKHPSLQLPALSILDSEGIASDQEYVDSFFKGDGLISSGKEFLHDQFLHIVPLLKSVFDFRGKYRDVANFWRDKFSEYLIKPLQWAQANKHLQFSQEQLTAVAGMLVDMFLGTPMDDIPTPLKAFQSILFTRNEDLWANYMYKRFGVYKSNPYNIFMKIKVEWGRMLLFYYAVKAGLDTTTAERVFQKLADRSETYLHPLNCLYDELRSVVSSLFLLSTIKEKGVGDVSLLFNEDRLARDFKTCNCCSRYQEELEEYCKDKGLEI